MIFYINTTQVLRLNQTIRTKNETNYVFSPQILSEYLCIWHLANLNVYGRLPSKAGDLRRFKGALVFRITKFNIKNSVSLKTVYSYITIDGLLSFKL